LEILNRENDTEVTNRQILVKNQQKALDDCTRRMDRLIELYISPTNQDKALISDEELKDRKSSLIKEPCLGWLGICRVQSVGPFSECSHPALFVGF
jgi:hypothetical protein